MLTDWKGGKYRSATTIPIEEWVIFPVLPDQPVNIEVIMYVLTHGPECIIRYKIKRNIYPHNARESVLMCLTHVSEKIWFRVMLLTIIFKRSAGSPQILLTITALENNKKCSKTCVISIYSRYIIILKCANKDNERRL